MCMCMSWQEKSVCLCLIKKYIANDEETQIKMDAHNNTRKETTV